jgi:diaminohydroxyphosphoribosylaminopyrimidine deaminase/5-amino-6-(5-phosphoribosylamino)uracil reductase
VKVHEFYINRCLELAKNGLGTTYPNPMVGCVIVHNHTIIGEGWHQKSGEAHAEVKAINSVKEKALLSKSTLYVSLEPCSHFGKTPPCCDLIVKHKIPNVIVGITDPHSKVAGSGIEKLQENGIDVMVGVLEKECYDINKRFFTYHQKKRPYIILKWAESPDGFIAPLTKEKKSPFWISAVYSRQLVHKWRSEEQSILVGTKTVLDDNPKLDVRDWTGNNPIRIVIDQKNSIGDEHYVKDEKSKTIIITSDSNYKSVKNYIYENAIFNSNLANQIAAIAYKQGIQSILIEGGKKTIQSFIDLNVWDEARVIIGTTPMTKGIEAPIIKGTYTSTKIKNDQLNLFVNHD